MCEGFDICAAVKEPKREERNGDLRHDHDESKRNAHDGRTGEAGFDFRPVASAEGLCGERRRSHAQEAQTHIKEVEEKDA